MRYLALSLLTVALLTSLTHSVSAQGTSGTTYTNLSVTDTGTINWLQVTSAAAFTGTAAIGPGSATNTASFGGKLWTGGPDAWASPTGANMAFIGSSDFRPYGFSFKLLPDGNGNTVPTLLSNHMGVGPLPLDLNTDNNGAPSPGPVLIGTYDWDHYSMFLVQGASTFTGEVDTNGPVEKHDRPRCHDGAPGRRQERAQLQEPSRGR
jgi:hypothetical protein